MSNILERHLEQNIEPTTTKESYIDKAIQIFQDMKEEDITKDNEYTNHKGKYCLNGLFSHMTGFRGEFDFCSDSSGKLGYTQNKRLSEIHFSYVGNKIHFEQMRTQAIEYMESLK